MPTYTIYYDAVIHVSGVAEIDAASAADAIALAESLGEDAYVADSLPTILPEHLTAVTVTDVEPEDDEPVSA